MEIQTLAPLLHKHPFFSTCTASQVDYLAGCAKNVVFHAGDMMFEEGDNADTFYLIREGSVSVDLHTVGRGDISLCTLGAGEAVGWSWLIPPYQYQFDAKAIKLTRALAMDGTCLREKCETDPALGYTLLKSFSGVMAKRLHATRMQLMDWYGFSR